MKHTNNGDCPKCDEIFNSYPRFHVNMKNWFKAFQFQYPEAHISCAGRGEISQNELFARGATRAKWMKSAHNYNCAIDVFCMLPGSDSIYPKPWFTNILAPRIPHWLNWYGAKGSPFYELPHIELRDWKQFLLKGDVKLVGVKSDE